MYLKRLEIQGFKSFAHKTVLDFDPGMTAVVGPNGSGKSNVADSLRWVMGEQSLKLLRGKKSEDVIFAGSDKKSKLSMAEVALTFDNKDHKLPLEYSEVVISRRIYRDGESEYLINNQRSRLVDVVEILMRSGFGATNYAVIGQGTIDQMVLAGPAEIKSLVEEAAGVKPYYIKREKTIRRLEQTEENLLRVSELLAEIEPRLKSLRRQAKRMEEREAIGKELEGYQIQYFGSQFYLLETEMSALNEQLGLKNSAITKLESEMSDFQKVLEKEEQQNKATSSFVYELNTKITVLESQRYKLQEILAEIRGKIKAGLTPGKMDAQGLNAEKLDLERNLEQLNNKLKQLTAALTNDTKSYDELKQKVSHLESELRAAQHHKLDYPTLNRLFAEFENEFNKTLETLTLDNVSDIKQKLKNIVNSFTSQKNSFVKEENFDLSQTLKVKDELLSELHQLELKMVEQKTLKQTYDEQINHSSARLNQIKSLLKDNPEEFKDELFKQEAHNNAQLNEIEKNLLALNDSLNKVQTEEKNKKTFLVAEEKKFRQQSLELAHLKDDQSKILIEKAKIETRLEGLKKEVNENLPGKWEQVIGFKTAEIPADVPNKISRLKHQLELAGGVDEATIIEYKETEERFAYLSTQSTDLGQAVTDLRSVIEELDQIIKKQFNEAFAKISEKFSEYFRILFNGGKAQMNLLRASVTTEEGVEEMEEGEAMDQKQTLDGVRTKKAAPEVVGIEIKATPPGKKLATIAALSGGERALTAIALLCSMLASYPSPFVVLDEVDAALDEANSIRFAKILGTLAHQTQFITITHNRATMKEAHTLYGVTMNDEGISKIISLKLEQAETQVKN